jgi:hypothetical protein
LQGLILSVDVPELDSWSIHPPPQEKNGSPTGSSPLLQPTAEEEEKSHLLSGLFPAALTEFLSTLTFF